MASHFHPAARMLGFICPIGAHTCATASTTSRAQWQRMRTPWDLAPPFWSYSSTYWRERFPCLRVGAALTFHYCSLTLLSGNCLEMGAKENVEKKKRLGIFAFSLSKRHSFPSCQARTREL